MGGCSGKEVLGIDAGTQGISVILWCPERKSVLAVGEAAYEHDYIPGPSNGRLEQYAHYWSDALKAAMAQLRQRFRDACKAEIDRVAGIGVTGHMHCMVRLDDAGRKPFGCDMWNDPRGVPESRELSKAFAEHMPGRWTVCHVLASMRNEPDAWANVRGINVTSGSIVHDLTGAWTIGPGDASGMMGLLDEAGAFDETKARQFDELSGCPGPSILELVPDVIPAGRVAGRLNKAGRTLLGGLPEGIPVAGPEGDQQSVLVGAGAGELELALSAGTSFTGNLPTSRRVKAHSEAFNVLHTPDLQTMLMVCARNGTVGFARYVKALSALKGCGFAEMADELTGLAAQVPDDAFGTFLIPFFQGENVAELPGARAVLHEAGLEWLDNPGLTARLLLEGPCMTLRYGIEKLKSDAGMLRAVLLTGGALKSQGGYAPQLYADILGVPVRARTGDEEGTAKGAAVLAAYMVHREAGGDLSLTAFMQSQVSGSIQEWQPDDRRHQVFTQRFGDFTGQVEAMQKAAGCAEE